MPRPGRGGGGAAIRSPSSRPAGPRQAPPSPRAAPVVTSSTASRTATAAAASTAHEDGFPRSAQGGPDALAASHAMAKKPASGDEEAERQAEQAEQQLASRPAGERRAYGSCR